MIPRAKPCESPTTGGYDANPAVPANFNGFTGWKNKKVGVWAEEAGDLRFNDFRVADNLEAGIEVTYTEWSKPYKST